MSAANGRLKCKIPTLRVEVPELVSSDHLFVRAVASSEARAIQDACHIDDATDVASVMRAMSDLVILCLSDESGKRILTDDNRSQVDSMPIDVVKRLGMAALDVNGLSETSEKNAVSRNGDLPSGLLGNLESQTLTTF